MADLLVPLYGLPQLRGVDGVLTARPLPHQAPRVLRFIEDTFSAAWAAESGVAFQAMPPTMHVSSDEGTGKILGFCCWDCTARGLLGPVGTVEQARGRGIGRELVLKVLNSMREAGYAYAVVGDAGPVEFFQKICNAYPIPDSSLRVGRKFVK